MIFLLEIFRREVTKFLKMMKQTSDVVLRLMQVCSHCESFRTRLVYAIALGSKQ